MKQMKQPNQAASLTPTTSINKGHIMAIGLIIIGDEILSGKRVDQHLPKVIALLKERGLQLAWS